MNQKNLEIENGIEFGITSSSSKKPKITP